MFTTSALQGLVLRLHYEFKDQDLLEQAFRHSSSLPARERVNSNERLEFLGDAALEIIVTRHLYRRFPQADEAKLSQIRAELVSTKALANAARHLGYNRWLQVGRGQENIRESDGVLADLMEAIIGAAYLDGGDQAAEMVIRRSDLLREIGL